MNYLLDSNTVSDLYDKWSKDHPKISQHLHSLSERDTVYISILTFYELEYGWANAPDGKKDVIRRKIGEIQQDFDMLSLSLSRSKNVRGIQKIHQRFALPLQRKHEKVQC